MSLLIPIKYRDLNYPEPIEANICEIAGNFDIESISVDTPYSLHTEYSYGAKALNSKIINDLEGITSAQKEKNGIPQLWLNEAWAKDFFYFIERLTNDNPPDVLEVHPPFNDYCSSFEQFMQVFRVFYDKIKNKYPLITILIENRFGTMYKGGRFLLQYCSDVIAFCNILFNDYSDIDFKIVLDYPQLISAETKMNFTKFDKIFSFNEKLEKYIDRIGGFHMWGKKKSDSGKWVAHQGNLDDFFSKNCKLKEDFLKSVSTTFDDGIARYFVPEVNSGQSDLHTIVNDMKKYGFRFESDHLSKAIQKSFNFRLPEEYLANRKRGFFEKDDRSIKFCFGNKNGKEYMDYFCEHRMTNIRHGRIFEDESEEILPAPDYFIYDNNDPEDYKNKRHEILNLLRKKGFI